jgi:glucose-6-phosphate 1-dehydrogenase
MKPRCLLLFGATGDLAMRMLFPALLELFERDLMPSDFRLIGTGRHSPGSDEEFRKRIRDELGDDAKNAADWDGFARRIGFVVSEDDDMTELAAVVRAAEEEIGAEGERLIYLSVPPATVADLARTLDSSGLLEGASIVVEKPFGEDLESARDLNRELHEVMDEEAIFRIDHFLGDEGVLGLIAMRAAGSPLDAIWNREHVTYVQVDVPEEIDIEGRGSFYEDAGAFRDMIVNHLLQVAGVVAMPEPEGDGLEGLPAARTAALAAIEPLSPERTVFGQYEGYRDEDDVDPESDTETLAALTLTVDDDRWRGVPFHLRTGKAMALRAKTVTVGLGGTEIRFDLGEEPQTEIALPAKVPGPGFEVREVALRTDEDADGALAAYARLLLDAMRGDHSLFAGADQVERLWEICDPILRDPPEPLPYARGSWGPEPAVRLADPPGWRLER